MIGYDASVTTPYKKVYLRYHVEGVDGHEFVNYVRLTRSRYKSNQSLNIMMKLLDGDGVLRSITSNITDTDKIKNKTRHAYVDLSPKKGLKRFLEEHHIGHLISEHEVDGKLYGLYSFPIEDIPEESMEYLTPSCESRIREGSRDDNHKKDKSNRTLHESDSHGGSCESGESGETEHDSGDWKKVYTDMYHEWVAWECPECMFLMELEEGTPYENSAFYCPRCGKRLIYSQERE